MRKESVRDESDKISTIEQKIEQFRVFGLSVEKRKDEALEKVLEARRKGLTIQEEQARGMLRKCMAMQKRADGMLMTLELAVQSRDLVSLQSRFLECMSDVAETINANGNKKSAKRVGRKYVKAMLKSKKQADKIDRLIEECDFATAVYTDTDGYSEFDSEIDTLIKKSESRGEGLEYVRSLKI